jgi:formamidopyrimidine-DNA glycosylase
MPELPEVQTVVTTLSPRVIGNRIARVVHVRPDMITPAQFNLTDALEGRTIQSVTRRGKRIVIQLDDGNTWFIHLGMTGRLQVERRDATVEPHTHLILDLEPAARTQRVPGPARPAHALRAGYQLRFRDPRRFGEIRWLGAAHEDPKMGPEPLSMRKAQLQARLSRTTRAIKNALMDQHVVAGLGNIYVDESLFAAGIHPLTPADQLTDEQVTRLTKSIKKVLRRAIRHRGSTLRDYVDAEGGKGAFQKLHSVYDRADQPCRTCRSPIERIVLGGRSTHFCAACQPLSKASSTLSKTLSAGSSPRRAYRGNHRHRPPSGDRARRPSRPGKAASP